MLTGAEREKAGPGKYVIKTLLESLTKAVVEGRGIEVDASLESRDRVKDIIRVRGWDLTDFRKNPVMLLGHAHDGLPIGTWPSVKKDIHAEPRVLRASGEFAETDLAAEVNTLVQDRVLRAVSVGFIPIEFKAMYDEDENFEGFDFQKQSLMEISVVPVGMHPDALVTALKAGHVRETEGFFCKHLGSRYPDLLRYADLDPTPDAAEMGEALAATSIRLGVTEAELRFRQIRRRLDGRKP